MLIPRAKFLVVISQHIITALQHSNQPWTTLLFIIGVVILSIPTIAFMAAQVSAVYYFTKLKLGLKGGLIWLICCLMGLVATVAIMISRFGFVNKFHRLPNLREIGFLIGMYPPSALKWVMYGIIMLTASSIGYLVSLRIKDKNLLLPVVMFAASIDFWTVTVGPVSSVMKHTPEIVSAVSAPIPHAGTGAFIPATMMGPGDPLFMAVVFAAVHRLGMNGRRNYWFVFVIMSFAMLLVTAKLMPYLPALVALAIAVVAANWREFKLSKQEMVSTAVVGVALIAAVLIMGNAFAPKKEIKKKPTTPISAPKSPAQSLPPATSK